MRRRTGRLFRRLPISERDNTAPWRRNEPTEEYTQRLERAEAYLGAAVDVLEDALRMLPPDDPDAATSARRRLQEECDVDQITMIVRNVRSALIASSANKREAVA